MNRDRFYGICKQITGTVKEHWGTLIGNQFMVAASKSDWIAGRIQARRGALKQENERQLGDFAHRNRNWWNLTKR